MPPATQIFMNHISNKLTLLNEVILECVNEADEQVIASKFVKTAVAVLGANYGFSWFKEPKDEEFKRLYKTENTPYTPTAPRKHGVMARVFENKTPLLVTDAAQADFLRGDARAYMQSVAVIPVAYRDKTYGTLVICYNSHHDFSSEEQDLCTFIGNGAAQAITINRLNRNLQEANQQLKVKFKERTTELEQNRSLLSQDKVKDEILLNSIGEGILLTDKEGKIILVNREAERIFGCRQDELIGKFLLDTEPMLNEQHQPIEHAKRPIYRALHHFLQTKSKNVFYQKKNGSRIPVVLTASPVMYHGQIIGFIQVFRDVTKEREMDKTKSELISLVSHQLRTPLSAINWYAEALLSGEIGRLTKDQRRYLQAVYKANQKMVELVYDFLNVSRIELGTFTIKLSVISIKELLEDIVKEISPIIKEKKLRVQMDFSKNLKPILSDRKVIRLVLQNLVTNAVKYTPSRGTINTKISIAKQARKKPVLRITVADTGYGIPRHQQNKVFTKLFRADNAAKLDTEGSGLGLYLVKSFLDYCKGKISFKSRENKGTVFYIELPVEVAK